MNSYITISWKPKILRGKWKRGKWENIKRDRLLSRSTTSTVASVFFVETLKLLFPKVTMDIWINTQPTSLLLRRCVKKKVYNAL